MSNRLDQTIFFLFVIDARKVCDFIVQNNKDLWRTIMKLQEKLGIKLKISPVPDDLFNRTMKFGFDSNDVNRNYVIFAFDKNSKRFSRKHNDFYDLHYIIVYC